MHFFDWSRGPATVYLIAFKDHVIRTATFYSVEGTTLYYTTPQGKGDQAPLDSIDVPFTQELNRERNVFTATNQSLRGADPWAHSAKQKP